jgi:gluconate 2-dehydrogenase gamma chain
MGEREAAASLLQCAARTVRERLLMNSDGGNHGSSRRSFLGSGGGWLAGAWIAAQWPAIKATAHEAAEAAAQPGDTALKALSAGDAADVDAIAAQIVPSGDTPGAREAHAMVFIDRALSSFFAAQADGFRQGLAEFQAKCRASHPQETFAALSPQEQLGFLKTQDQSPFFGSVRGLTLLGMFAAPKYGGNYQGAGWKLMGFEDRHAFTPPFGYYDRDYPGFRAAAATARPADEADPT